MASPRPSSPPTRCHPPPPLRPPHLAEHYTDTDSPATSTSFSPLPLPQQQYESDFAQPAPESSPYAMPISTDAHLADTDFHQDDPPAPPPTVGLITLRRFGYRTRRTPSTTARGQTRGRPR